MPQNVWLLVKRIREERNLRDNFMAHKFLLDQRIFHTPWKFSFSTIFVNTCFVGHLRGRIQWQHSFSHLTQSQVRSRNQISELNINLKKKLTNGIYFCFSIPKMSLLLCRTYRNAKYVNAFQKHAVNRNSYLFTHCTDRYKGIALKNAGAHASHKLLHNT